MSINLSNFKPVDESRMVIRHPIHGVVTDDKGKEFFIKGQGSDSETYKKYNRKVIDVKKRNGKIDYDELERRLLELLAAVVTDCYMLDEENKPIKPTFENMIMIFKNCPDIREQWGEHIADRENFIKG